VAFRDNREPKDASVALPVKFTPDLVLIEADFNSKQTDALWSGSISDRSTRLTDRQSDEGYLPCGGSLGQDHRAKGSLPGLPQFRARSGVGEELATPNSMEHQVQVLELVEASQSGDRPTRTDKFLPDTRNSYFGRNGEVRTVRFRNNLLVSPDFLIGRGSRDPGEGRYPQIWAARL
jgi:hypothetical protein